MNLDEQVRQLVDVSRQLTPNQETAIDMLAAGESISATARAIAVSRQTVSHWVNHHPGVKAALNQRRHDLLAARTDRIREIDQRALEIVAASLDESGTFGEAMAWIKARRIDVVDVAEVGETDVEKMINAEVSARSLTESDYLLDIIGRAVDTKEAERWLAEKLDDLNSTPSANQADDGKSTS